jgi:dihydrofolate reductase
MRKLVVSMNVTIDGFIAGPDRGLDWHYQNWTEDMSEFAVEQLSRADTILLGRVTYESLAAYWPLQAINLLCPRSDIAYADMMNHYSKIVFSKTLRKTDALVLGWNKSMVIKKNIKTEISRLKKLEGKDIIVFGSGTLVSALMQFNLIDEYHVWVHPVFIGSGTCLFKDSWGKLKLQLLSTKEFKSGVILLRYKLQPHNNNLPRHTK